MRYSFLLWSGCGNMGCQVSTKYFGQKLKLRIDNCIDKVGHHFRNQNVSKIKL